MGLITVKFIVDFPPYHLLAGQTRQVSESVAKKLYETYKVIEPYDGLKEPIVTVRVIKNMNKIIKGWFPGTEQLAVMSRVRQYVDEGLIVVVNKGQETVQSPVNSQWANGNGFIFKPESVIATFLSSSDHEGTPEHVTHCISLITQDGQLAQRIYKYGIENGMLHEANYH